jgi:hypothetical protein
VTVFKTEKDYQLKMPVLVPSKSFLFYFLFYFFILFYFFYFELKQTYMFLCPCVCVCSGKDRDGAALQEELLVVTALRQRLQEGVERNQQLHRSLLGFAGRFGEHVSSGRTSNQIKSNQIKSNQILFTK